MEFFINIVETHAKVWYGLYYAKENECESDCHLLEKIIDTFVFSMAVSNRSQVLDDMRIYLSVECYPPCILRLYYKALERYAGM